MPGVITSIRPAIEHAARVIVTAAADSDSRWAALCMAARCARRTSSPSPSSAAASPQSAVPEDAQHPAEIRYR